MLALLDLYATRATEIAEFSATKAAFEAEQKRHSAEVNRLNAEIALHGAGIDTAKVTLARTVLKVYGSYARGGQDRASVIRDAIDWLATGRCSAYCGLDGADFGTKNYDRWSGQRSDHEWGGPRHGSICFQIGLKDRKAPLTDEQREAALYFLTNIEVIQAAEASAKEAA